MHISPLASIEDVEARYLALPGQYQAWKEECEAKVVSWRWATNALYDPRPLYRERQGWRNGRFHKTIPAEQRNQFEYGLSADGRIHVMRNHIRFDGKPDRIWFYETFYRHCEDGIEVAHFEYDPGKRPISYAVGLHNGGRLTLWQDRAQYGRSRESYTWDGDRVAEVDIEYAPVADMVEHVPLLRWNRYAFTYDAKGAVEEILCHWYRRPDHPEEATEVVYRRLPKQVALRDLFQTMRSELMQAVLESVRNAQISEPVYALALYWDPGQSCSLPPVLALGLESERMAWLAAHGEGAQWYLWNPAEYRTFLPLQSVPLEEVCRPINQECQLRESWHEAAKLLNAVAKDLGRMDWTGILPITDDFVAYAVEHELVDLGPNMRVSVPPRLLKAFERKGWLLEQG